mgnify:CR=1 FL=1
MRIVDFYTLWSVFEKHFKTQIPPDYFYREPQHTENRGRDIV